MELKLLKEKKLKVTQQRLDILKEIIALDLNATIKNICDELSHIDKSTVYRTLDTLEKAEVISKNTNVDNEIFYEIKKDHKHYLYCVECKTRIETNHCFLHHNEYEGFIVLNHSLEINGICANCQKKKKQK